MLAPVVVEELGWYDRRRVVDVTPYERVRPVAASADQVAADVDDDLVELPLRVQDALTPFQVAAARRREWLAPGMYSWWVDEADASDLSAGLGELVEAGRITSGRQGRRAGRAGAGRRTRCRSVWLGMHLGYRADFSTFPTHAGPASCRH